MTLRLAAVALLLPSLVFAQTGDTLGTHDPAIAEHNGTYYVYSTGVGLPIRTSKDLVTWTKSGRVFSEVPAWAKRKIPAVTALWAPDLSFFNNRWHLYYAASSFGSDNSVIGLATNPTLDPASPDYEWTDQGLVIESLPKGGWNAIDPALHLDENNRPVLFFGSFWGGIKAIHINPATGKPADSGYAVLDIAARPDTKARAIEAAFVLKRDDYFYLFVSFDLCCKGVESTYNIRVGRSKSLLGPYADMAGRNMSSGGGTLVLAGESLLRGPGHNAAITVDDTDYLVYHIYDMNNSGQPTLQIRRLIWDKEGWPLPGPLLSSPPTFPAPHPPTPSPQGTWLHYTDTNPHPTTITLHPDHTITPSGNATWSANGTTLTLTWPDHNATDTLLLLPDGTSYVGRNQSHTLIRGSRDLQSTTRPSLKSPAN
jgi:arabinan endo-1,5-alpha-L-arabinosidase